MAHVCCYNTTTMVIDLRARVVDLPGVCPCPSVSLCVPCASAWISIAGWPVISLDITRSHSLPHPFLGMAPETIKADPVPVDDDSDNDDNDDNDNDNNDDGTTTTSTTTAPKKKKKKKSKKKKAVDATGGATTGGAAAAAGSTGVTAKGT